MALIQPVLFLILVLIVGWSIPRVLKLKICVWERLGLSPFLGFGLISILYFLFNFNLKINIHIWPLLSTVTVLLLLFHHRYEYVPVRRFHRSGLSVILLSLSLCALAYSCLQSLYWPLWSPDAVYLYDFRAKLLITYGNFDYLSQKFPNTLAYPPFTSLIHYFFYSAGFSSATLLYPMTFFGFWLVIYGWVSRFSHSSFKGLLTATLIVITPSILWNSFLGLPNIIYTELLTLSLFYLLDALSISKFSLLSGFLLGLAVFTRMEGFWLVPVSILISLCLYRRRFLPLIPFFLVFIPIIFLWPKYTNSVHSPPPLNQISIEIESLNHLTKGTNAGYQNNGGSFRFNLLPVIKFMIPSLFSSWGFLPILVLFLFIWELIFLKKVGLIMLIATALPISVIIGFVIFASRNSYWPSLESSLYRMATLVIPFVWVAIVTSTYWDKIKTGIK